jgi:hypothetical protein
VFIDARGDNIVLRASILNVGARNEEENEQCDLYRSLEDLVFSDKCYVQSLTHSESQPNFNFGNEICPTRDLDLVPS